MLKLCNLVALFPEIWLTAGVVVADAVHCLCQLVFLGLLSVGSFSTHAVAFSDR